MSKGWYKEPIRHSLSSKGIKTNISSKGIKTNINTNNSDDLRDSIIREVKRGLDNDFVNENKLLYGNCGIYALYLSELLDVPIYGVKSPSKEKPSHYFVKIDDEFYDANGKVDVDLLDVYPFIFRDSMVIEKIDLSEDKVDINPWEKRKVDKNLDEYFRGVISNE